MIDDASYTTAAEPVSRDLRSRWIVFLTVLVMGIVLIVTPFYFSLEYWFAFWIVPPTVIFMVYIAFRWAQGKPIAPTDRASDERVFDEMRLHALPAEPADGIGVYRCPDCKMSFEPSNAQPVDDRVFLCPFCRVRLFIRG